MSLCSVLCFLSFFVVTVTENPHFLFHQFFSIVVSSILLCRSSSVYELVPDEEDTLDHFTINK